jgi:hypothetical protein
MNNENNFVVSIELLLLVRWLLEQERESLKKLVVKSLQHGLLHELQAPREKLDCDELQQSIIDFFNYLEDTVGTLMPQYDVDQVIQRAMIPAINHIDKQQCDQEIVDASIAKASTNLTKLPQHELKSILCKELLKQWKPQKKSPQH